MLYASLTPENPTFIGSLQAGREGLFLAGHSCPP